MISDRIEQMLGQILLNTKEGLIDWQPIKEYWFIDSEMQNEEFFERIQMLRANEFVDFYEERSYYALKGEQLIAVLHYSQGSSHDDTNSEELEFVGAVNAGSYLMNIPCYLDGGVEAIQHCIEEYWNNKLNLDDGIPDILELLETFSKIE